jgi:hypothetical protein
MRLMAKRVQTQLDWSILDVEPEEWDRRMADLGVAAAANGFPFPAAAAPTGTDGDYERAAASQMRRLRIGRHVVFAGLGALMMAALVGFTVWREAEAGIARMAHDVANVVQLEAVQARAQLPAQRQDESLAAVVFRDGTALAVVVITRTLATGEVAAVEATRFYRQTPQGWQAVAPVAAFWGATETLDTPSLHLVFGSRDRAAVARLAPAIEELYALLRRATGQDLAAGGPLTVEFVPRWVPFSAQLEAGRIAVTSPLLHWRGVNAGSEDALTLLQLRRLLVEELAAAALAQAGYKAQWQQMAAAYQSWLSFTDTMQPAFAGERATVWRLQSAAATPLPLYDLLSSGGNAPGTGLSFSAYSPAALYRADMKQLAAEQLIDFLVASYGLDVLPKLLQGFGEHKDWETLAPAVLGISAAELEHAWHASPTTQP